MGPLPPPQLCSKVTLSGTPAWQRDFLPSPSLPSPLALVKDSSCPRHARVPRHTGQPCPLPSPLRAVTSAVWWELSKQSQPRVNLRAVGRDERVPASRGRTGLGDLSLPQLFEEQRAAAKLQLSGGRVAAETAGPAAVPLPVPVWCRGTDPGGPGD